MTRKKHVDSIMRQFLSKPTITPKTIQAIADKHSAAIFQDLAARGVPADDQLVQLAEVLQEAIAGALEEHFLDQ